MSEDGVAEQKLTELTRDPARARRLRRSLEAIAERGGDPAMREMAREVLSGRLGLREAAQVPAYSEAMRESMERGLRAYEGMSEEERRAAEEEGRRQLDEVQQELDEEQRERVRQSGSSGSPGKHSGRGWRL